MRQSAFTLDQAKEQMTHHPANCVGVTPFSLLYVPKGQLISESLFAVFNFPKENNENFDKFLRMWSNQQNKGTFLKYYSLYIVIWVISKLKCIKVILRLDNLQHDLILKIVLFILYIFRN